MTKKISIIQIITAILLISSSLVYADEPTLAKCILIKNTKQRLTCYDTIAPETTKRLNQLYGANSALPIKKDNEDSIAKEQQKKNEDEVTALKEQKILVKDTIKEIRKLTTATKVGISKGEYARRVIDVASTVQSNLNEIKNQSVHNQLQDALQA